MEQPFSPTWFLATFDVLDPLFQAGPHGLVKLPGFFEVFLRFPISTKTELCGSPRSICHSESRIDLYRFVAVNNRFVQFALIVARHSTDGIRAGVSRFKRDRFIAI